MNYNVIGPPDYNQGQIDWSKFFSNGQQQQNQQAKPMPQGGGTYMDALKKFLTDQFGSGPPATFNDRFPSQRPYSIDPAHPFTPYTPSIDANGSGY